MTVAGRKAALYAQAPIPSRDSHGADVRVIQGASSFSGHADQVFSPETEEQVAEILSSAEGIPVTGMGALTGLAGGAVPQGGWALSLTKFSRLEVHPEFARSQAGVLQYSATPAETIRPL